MKGFILYKSNMWGRVLRYKLCFCLALGAMVFSVGCRQSNTGGEQKPPISDDITITVMGDDGVTVKDPNTIKVKKGSTWKDIKQQVLEKIESKEIKEWRIKDVNGAILQDTDKFEKNTVVFAVSKRNIVQYKVEHLQENIENDEFTSKKIEEKLGEVGTNTDARAEQYEGFEIPTIEQKEIKADGSTVVKIRYKRKMISLTIDLKDGETKTKLADGRDGKKLLSGKFEAEVRIETPNKSGFQFEGWEPELPTHFPANDTNVYTAKWIVKTAYRVSITGDERVKVVEPKYIDVPIIGNKTIGDIKAEIVAKATLSDGWSNEDYDFYDWRIDGEKGDEMQDAIQITKDMTVYARTNYKKFKITNKNTVYILDGYNGEKPRGRIFLPKEIRHISTKAFNGCNELTVVDLSVCTELAYIGLNHRADDPGAFENCTNLESIDLSSCTKFTNILGRAFSGCTKAVVKLPTSISSIGNKAFGENESNWCKKVSVPSQKVKNLVKGSGYHENRIDLY